MTDTPLSPCPICGGAPVRNGRGTSGGVLCYGKDVPGLMHRLQVYGDGQADADATWNHRAQDTWEVTRQKAIEEIDHIGRIMNLMHDRYLAAPPPAVDAVPAGEVERRARKIVEQEMVTLPARNFKMKTWADQEALVKSIDDMMEAAVRAATRAVAEIK